MLNEHTPHVTDGYNYHVKLNNYADTKQLTTKLTATVGISSPGTKFELVRDYIYTVQRQEFSEEQIKTALKKTYPEQFI